MAFPGLPSGTGVIGEGGGWEDSVTIVHSFDSGTTDTRPAISVYSIPQTTSRATKGTK
jgi:hypothetical protein